MAEVLVKVFVKVKVLVAVVTEVVLVTVNDVSVVVMMAPMQILVKLVRGGSLASEVVKKMSVPSAE